MRRVAVFVVAGLIGAAIAVVPALGANTPIQATASDTWTPSNATINVGDTIDFSNGGGFHDITFEDGGLHSPASGPSALPWTASRTFTAPGVYRFYCSVHGGPGGQGMSGTITVVDPNAPPPTDTTTTTTTTPPPVADAFSAKPVQGHFCAKHCKKPGVRVTFNASAATTAVGTVQRRILKSPRGGKYKSFGTLKVKLAAGKHQVAVGKTTSGKTLGVGDYRIVFKALGHTSTVTFFVRP